MFYLTQVNLYQILAAIGHNMKVQYNLHWVLLILNEFILVLQNNSSHSILQIIRIKCEK